MPHDGTEIDILKTLVITGGIILTSLQGKVTNIPKISALPVDKVRPSSTAHTIADDLVQEVILEVLYTYLPDIRVHVEETTSRVKRFSNNTSKTCFHLDPLDGTLAYVQNRTDYAIGAAFTHDRVFTSSAIYFPATDRVYYAEKGTGVHVQTSLGEQLTFTRSSRASDKYLQKRCETYVPVVKNMHLEEEDLRSAHQGMIAIAEGRARVQLYHLASPHDFGIPKLLVEEAGGVCTDNHGKVITFGPEFTRVPYFFAFYDRTTRDEFFTWLKNKNQS